LIIYRTIIPFFISIVLFNLNPSSLYSAQIFTLIDDQSGYCCINGTLKIKTTKQCRKSFGIFYSIKEKSKASKKCIKKTAQKTGYCCKNNVLNRKSSGECKRDDGIYFSVNQKEEAKKQCARGKEPNYPAKQKKESIHTFRVAEKKGYCCVKHRLIRLSQADCQNKGLSFYPASKYALAKNQCSVEHGLCCIKGVLRKKTKTQCTRQQGSFFSLQEKLAAHNFCKPTPGYCCINFKIHKTDKLKCKGLEGKFFSQNEEFMALSECRRVEAPHSSQSSHRGSSTPANPDRSKEIPQTTSYQDKKIDQAIQVIPLSEMSPLPENNQNHSVPGQILVTLNNGPHSVDIINELLTLYDLTLLEIFELKSLQQKIILFHTNQIRARFHGFLSR